MTPAERNQLARNIVAALAEADLLCEDLRADPEYEPPQDVVRRAEEIIETEIKPWEDLPTFRGLR